MKENIKMRAKQCSKYVFFQIEGVCLRNQKYPEYLLFKLESDLDLGFLFTALHYFNRVLQKEL